MVESGIDQGGAIPEQDVAAVPGCAAADLLRDAAGTPEKSERAVGATRVLKTDGADVELVIPVGVVCGRELLESVFLQHGGIGGIGSFGRGAVPERVHSGSSRQSPWATKAEGHAAAGAGLASAGEHQQRQ